jgi:peptide/nickel transport system permease protein
LVPIPGLFLDEQVYFSWVNHVTVKHEIMQAFPYTLVLTMGAMVLWLAIGIPIGILSAIRRRTWADRASMTFALFGVSMPTFWLGMLLIFVFYYNLGWAPPTGVDIGDGAIQTALKGKYILAWITLAVTSAAYYTRVVRGNMLEVLSEDYIRTARAKGLSERRVTYKHALRASLTPVVTMLGLDVAILLAGAVITENVFSIPGLGDYALRSLEAQDFPPVMAVTLLAAIFIVVANLVVDVFYAALDPRVRFT